MGYPNTILFCIWGAIQPSDNYKNIVPHADNWMLGMHV